MEPTVRGAWTQSGIAAAPSRSRIAAAQNPEYGFNCARTSRSATAAGNGIFGCRDRAPKTVAKMCERLQRQKSEKRVARNARRKALFDLVLETCGLRRLDGGVRSRMRTRLSGDSTLETAAIRRFPLSLVKTGNSNPKDFVFVRAIRRI